MSESQIDKFFLPVARWSTKLGLSDLVVLCFAILICSRMLGVFGTQAPRPRGCKRLGLNVQSNLADEHDPKYGSQISPAGRARRWTVKSLWIYPIKSCRGVELTSSTVVSMGMEYDRQFCFARFKGPVVKRRGTPEETTESAKWDFLTQRSHPLLACVKPEVWIPDPSSSTYSINHPEIQHGGVVVVKYPGYRFGFKVEKSFCVPYDPTPAEIERKGYKLNVMTIWNDSPTALQMDSVVPLDLKKYLNVKEPFSLFRVSKDHYREVYRCAPRKADVGYQPITGFADAYPLHILNIASVRDIGDRMEKLPKGIPSKVDIPRLSVLQFRGNFIVEGPTAYEEDDWKRIRIGGYEYYAAARTSRCLLPNTDQITGKKHPEQPHKEMQSFRCIDAGAPKSACVGMQMVPARERSEISVGDEVEVLEVGEHFYIKQ